ncbi:MAG: hypothetical protein KatS3mg060_1414 [Dehalococcoidia bacterium]|nr:MAG: hypothetical protein KatS3mg060_1414 [Dehalococcoidia bacterium]
MTLESDREQIARAADSPATVDQALNALAQLVARRLETKVQLSDGVRLVASSVGDPATVEGMAIPLRVRGRELGSLRLGVTPEHAKRESEFVEAAAEAAARLLLEREASRVQSDRLEELIFRAILDILPVGVFFVSRSGQRAFSNAVAAAMTDVAPTGGTDLRPPESPSGLRRAASYERMSIGETPMRLALDEGQETRGLDYVITSASGDDRIVRVSAAPVRDNAEIVGAVGAITDITAEDLQRRVLMESVECGVLIHNAFGLLILANVAASRLLEVTGTDAIARHLFTQTMRWSPGPRPPWEAVRESDLPSAAAILECTTATGRPIVVNATSRPLRRPDGALGHVVTTLIDATSTQRDRLALEESEQRFRTVFEQAEVGIAILDSDGRVVAKNDHLRRFVGRDDLEGDRLIDLLDPALREQPIEQITRLIDGETTGALGEFRFTSSEPGERWGKVTITTLRGSGAGTRMLLAIVEDISQQKLAERQVAAIGQAEKLRALGQMASGVAHDLNQYLGLVSGHGELALQELEQPTPNLARLRESLSVIVRAAQDGAESVRRIQAFTRSRPDRPAEKIDLAELLREVALLTAPKWRDAAQQEGRPIVLHVETGSEAIIEGWPESLREAFTNLVFNAVDALPKGGTIRLVLELDEDEVHALVVDNGVGMSSEVQARVFEPFFTTKGERGSGIGLSIVFATVERHRGRISIDSAPGRGTAFRLAFPLTVKDTSQPAARARTASKQLRVLAVDDDPALAQMLATMLASDGHHVVVAHSGEEALRILDAQLFDLVITDLGMGAGMNGWELTAMVQQRFPGMRVALATGWGADLDSEEASERGICGVLAKPYRMIDVREIVAIAAD